MTCCGASISEILLANTQLENNWSKIENLNNLFLENNWSQIENTTHLVTYSKHGFETDYFRIKMDNNFVFVTVPLKQIPFVYITKFKDLAKATEYMEIRFKELI